MGDRRWVTEREVIVSKSLEGFKKIKEKKQNQRTVNIKRKQKLKIIFFIFFQKFIFF
jgi:hypothetical protein